ncbi:MAG: hypothetical protein IPI35_32335 [Deltaproteobacteria bacterium]|nr:hypothetical protein [Deltaproteobacteria bacterium]
MIAARATVLERQGADPDTVAELRAQVDCAAALRRGVWSGWSSRRRSLRPGPSARTTPREVVASEGAPGPASLPWR